MDEGDACVALLTERLATACGVSEAHIVRENGKAQLCLHYDPDLISLGDIERLARRAGAAITRRYRHEAIPLQTMPAADVALMADDLDKLPFAVGLSRASRRVIVQNLAFSLGVIFLLIGASLAGVVALSGAVILHEGSTLVVVLNALRLLRYGKR